LGLALSYACFDEYRQSYFVNRTASPLDVMLDMTGAGTATAIGWRRVAPPKEES
ncbi:VanZ family protein, partial [Acinetobacter baumannii]